MIKKFLFLFLFFNNLVITYCLGGESVNQELYKTLNLPNDFQFFPKKIVDKFPTFMKEASLCPSFDLVDKKDKFRIYICVRSTEQWIRKIMKPEWIPNDLFNRLTPVKHSLCGNDAIWARYKKGEYSFQIVINSCRFILCVNPIKKYMYKTEKGNIDKSLDSICLFLNESDKIKTPPPTVDTENNIIHASKNIGDDWWENIQYRIFERSAIIVITKIERKSPLLPTLHKNWFELSKYEPIKKDPNLKKDNDVKIFHLFSSEGTKEENNKNGKDNSKSQNPNIDD